MESASSQDLSALGEPLAAVMDRGSISDLALQMLGRAERERLRLGEVVDAAAKRGFGVLIALLALPNVLPTTLIPGLSTLCGIPLLLIGGQMALGFTRPWFPEALRDRRAPLLRTERGKRTVLVAIRLIERCSRPRCWPGHAGLDRALGAVVTLLALPLIAPVPLSNLAPAIALLVIGLGLAQQDGLVILAGCLLAILGLGLFVAVVIFGAAALAELF